MTEQKAYMIDCQINFSNIKKDLHCICNWSELCALFGFSKNWNLMQGDKYVSRNGERRCSWDKHINIEAFLQQTGTLGVQNLFLEHSS